MEKNRENFLSHLCGDEEVGRAIASALGFLSHLCGDEGLMEILTRMETFLSHLCGDEADPFQRLGVFAVSKSPMR